MSDPNMPNDDQNQGTPNTGMPTPPPMGGGSDEPATPMGEPTAPMGEPAPTDGGEPAPAGPTGDENPTGGTPTGM